MKIATQIPSRHLYIKPGPPRPPRFGIDADSFPPAQVNVPKSGIHYITWLANQHPGTLSLAQGTPSGQVAPAVKASLAELHLSDNLNKYTAVEGLPVFREAVANKLNRFLQPATPYKTANVLATHGATNAFYVAMSYLLKPGDSVLMADPYYGLYAGSIALHRAKIQTMTSNAQQGFKMDIAAFEKSIVGLPPYLDHPKIPKMLKQAWYKLYPPSNVIVLNTPHNPSGNVLTREELTQIGAILDRVERETGRKVVVVCDETYEHIVFDNKRHVSPASVPALQKRLMLVGTLSKTYNTTGYRIGYLVGPETVIDQCKNAYNHINMCLSAPYQMAGAKALNELPDTYYADLSASYEKRRQMVYDLLKKVGMEPVMPEGGYFMLAKVDTLYKKLGFKDDIEFVEKYLIPQVGVAFVPGSYLFKDKQTGQQYIRASFCQDEKTIKAVGERLLRHLSPQY